jgi:prevent-host-death family protein
MSKSLTVSEARDQLAELIGQVQYGGERVTISKRGKPVAVVVSVADAAWLEAMEDKIDVDLAREALAEMERMGGKTYSHEEVFADPDDADEDA